ncbi:hypothetical protein HOG47_03900 [archaeon]|jgi:hypothetical protein|nr:hypothetical protein [archaeon]
MADYNFPDLTGIEGLAQEYWNHDLVVADKKQSGLEWQTFLHYHVMNSFLNQNTDATLPLAAKQCANHYNLSKKNLLDDFKEYVGL